MNKTEPSQAHPALELVEKKPHWLAFNKAAGVPFQSENITAKREASCEEEGSPATLAGMVELVKAEFKGESYALHRLDKVTSGIQLFARDKATNQMLSAAFRERSMSKYYLALSHKRPRKKQGWVKGDMAKARGGSYKLLRTMANPAITQFAACSVNFQGRSCWLFLLKPHTGQTHQLRVALKSLGAPILGDKRYGGDDAERCYLHAWRLDFDDQGRKRQLIAPHRWGQALEQPLLTLQQKLGLVSH